MAIKREHIGAGLTRTACPSGALVMALLWSAGCVDQAPDPVADPANGLAAPGSVACVTIQRGVAGAVEDATIKSNALKQNFGSKPSLRVSAKDEALIRFDLRAIPSSAAIRSAKLKLFVSDNSDGGGTIQVHGVLAPWVENVVTFASFKQQFEGQAAAAFRAGNKKTFKSVDLAELVRAWVAGTRPNYGVLLEPGPDHHPVCERDEDEDRNSTILVSSDAPNRFERPALEVCYSLPADHCAPNPCLNGGTCSNAENGFSCQCAPGFIGEDCGMNVDDCSPNPCQNGGSCTDGVSGHSCTCQSGFSGATCEVNVNDCSPNPCQNGGICSDAVAGFSCECPPGYDGVNCEHLIDNCADSPCHNGGVCTSQANGYRCGCAPGYSGATCDTNIDDCVAGACQNGGTCIDDINSFHCSCAPDFGGSRCEINLNSCGQAPCLNGATCTNVAGGYTCQCAAGFTGPNCEVDIDDCAPNACLNGGLCVDGVNQYTCSCPAGFFGVRCDLSPPTISPSSGPLGTLVTITDPLRRIVASDQLAFYEVGASALSAVVTVDAVVSRDGATITATVRGIADGPINVEVVTGSGREPRFEALQFTVGCGCDDSNPCTVDSCDPRTLECVWEPADPTTVCQASSCTESSCPAHCIGGACVADSVIHHNGVGDEWTDSVPLATYDHRQAWSACQAYATAHPGDYCFDGDPRHVLFGVACGSAVFGINIYTDTATNASIPMAVHAWFYSGDFAGRVTDSCCPSVDGDGCELNQSWQ